MQHDCSSMIERLLLGAVLMVTTDKIQYAGNLAPEELPTYSKNVVRAVLDIGDSRSVIGKKAMKILLKKSGRKWDLCKSWRRFKFGSMIANSMGSTVF